MPLLEALPLMPQKRYKMLGEWSVNYEIWLYCAGEWAGSEPSRNG